MKYFFLLFIFTITSCHQKPKDSNPDSYLSKKEQDSFKYKVIRYIQRLPKYATEETKFNTQFDRDYKNSLKECDLIFYYKDENQYVYFGVSKIAPSIKLKKTATVGRLKINDNDSITFYEEAFRTWKMEPKELMTKTKLLFTKYINNEDLSPYYTVNSQPEFYIEFPDEHTRYDSIKRIWVLK